jgi:hypothetical protein
MGEEPKHIRATYNEIHEIIKNSSAEIAQWKPDMIIAIGELTLSHHELLDINDVTFQLRRRVGVQRNKICSLKD